MAGLDSLFKGIFRRSDTPAGSARGLARKETKRSQGYHLPENPQEGSLMDGKLSDNDLAEIFKHLSPRDLLQGPALVCQRWQRNSLQTSVWSSNISKFSVPEAVIKELPALEGNWAFPQLYKSLQTGNLLAGFIPNPETGDCDAWCIGPGSNWSVEHSPGTGMPQEHCPAELHPSDRIMASSYMLCSATQVVDLHAGFLKSGLKSETVKRVLDMGPGLEFFIWAGQRFDCGAIGAISLGFGSTGEEALKAPTPLLRADLAGGTEAAVTEEHWNKQKVIHVAFRGVHGMWKGYCCRIETLPGRSRYVSVTLEGQDTQFWAGHYGMKFGNPCLSWRVSESSESQMLTSSKPCFETSFGPDGVSSQWLQCLPGPRDM